MYAGQPQSDVIATNGSQELDFSMGEHCLKVSLFAVNPGQWQKFIFMWRCHIDEACHDKEIS